MPNPTSERSAETAAIAVERVRKVYGATVAVDEASFSIARGAVHALLGENGAGKSTIVKLLSGLTQPDSGGFRLFGDSVRFASPRDAQARGVETAFQEMTLVKDLTVLDNMLLPRGPAGPLGMIRRRQARAQVAAHFDALGMGDVHLDDEIGELDLAIQQKIEIARALYRQPRILLLDEPTSTLSGRDVDWLGQIIADQRAKGVTTVFISHRLREVRTFCDAMTVLRNGKHIATGPVAAYADDEVIGMIAGRALANAFPPRRQGARAFGAEVLGAERISTAGKLSDVSFSLRAGEVLGVAGLQGMGQLDLFLACFSMADLTSGHLCVDGKPIVFTSPTDAVRANIGISLVPEDRKMEALSLKLSGKYNASLPVIDRFAPRFLIDGAAENAAVAAVFDRVEV
ncbi:MAG: sugar ABC transporter ATP-binding protein, partial [Hyphomicrobiales bacterium]|nr:sugar ABC transporter ATP-binding protein [Hyphomicrobiales bacterium]